MGPDGSVAVLDSLGCLDLVELFFTTAVTDVTLNGVCVPIVRIADLLNAFAK